MTLQPQSAAGHTRAAMDRIGWDSSEQAIQDEIDRTVNAGKEWLGQDWVFSVGGWLMRKKYRHLAGTFDRSAVWPPAWMNWVL